LARVLERIAFYRNRDAVAIERAHPLDLNKIDQIHVVGGSLWAKPSDHDPI